MNSKQIAIHNEADEAWNQAYDATLNADKAAGRRYDRRMYAEAAHVASATVLKACDCKRCSLQEGA